MVAHIFRTDTLTCEENHGVTDALSLKCRVTGLEDTDYSVLMSALESAGIPSVPSGLAGDGFESLVLVHRSTSLVENDPGCVDVILKYEKLLDNQELFAPAGLNGNSTIYGRMKGSIKQKPTNFYRDWTQVAGTFAFTSVPDFPDDSLQYQLTVTGANTATVTTGAVGATVYTLTFTGGVPAAGGWEIINLGGGQYQFNPGDTQIFVTHTYPTSSTNPLELAPPGSKPGQPINQGGEIHADVAQRNFQIRGFVNTDDPDSIVDMFLDAVNSTTFKGKGPRQWKCVSVECDVIGWFRPNDNNPPITRYHFGFEFQHDPGTWDTDVVFNDPRTNKPPKGLVSGVGFKKIPYLRGIDFNGAFGFLVVVES